jgi:hypothetical protein
MGNRSHHGQEAMLMTTTPMPGTEPIPERPGLPLIGHALDIPAGADGLFHLMDQAKEQGPLFKLRIFSSEINFVSGLDLVTELSDETRFRKNVHTDLVNVRPIGGDGRRRLQNEAGVQISGAIPVQVRAHRIADQLQVRGDLESAVVSRDAPVGHRRVTAKGLHGLSSLRPEPCHVDGVPDHRVVGQFSDDHSAVGMRDQHNRLVLRLEQAPHVVRIVGQVPERRRVRARAR